MGTTASRIRWSPGACDPHGRQPGRGARHAGTQLRAASPVARCSACSITSRTASFCLSGGYLYLASKRLMALHHWGCRCCGRRWACRGCVGVEVFR